jgi:hypothetical protein
MSTGYMSNMTVFYKKPEVRTLRDQLNCHALFVIVLCLVSNERPVWLNELGSWIT